MRWLHFSDLHFQQGDYDCSAIRSKLIAYAEIEFNDIDFIVITGDVMHRGVDASGVVSFINDLRETVGCGTESLYLCPGNHDLERLTPGRPELVAEMRGNPQTFGKEDVQKLSGYGFSAFSSLYADLTKRMEYRHFEVIEGKASDGDYRIVSLNTCLLAGDDQDEGNLRIMSPLISDLGRRIASDGKVNIAIMHHGAEHLRPIERRKFEYWTDDNNIDVVLCGHVHKAGVRTYDDTRRSVKQFASGTAQYVNYDCPAFYCHEFDRSTGALSSSLYTYAHNTEEWGRDARCLRAFDDGVYEHPLKRFQNPESAPAILQHVPTPVTLGQYIEHFVGDIELRYKENFGEKIAKPGSRRAERFSSDAIIRSLISTGMPLSMALLVLSRAVEALINDKAALGSRISTIQLGDYIYNAIRKTPSSTDVSAYDLRAWSGKYARRYRRGGGKKVLLGNGKKRDATFKLMRQAILPEAFKRLLGASEEYDALSVQEKEYMAADVLRLVEGIDVDAISFECLVDIVAEVMQRTPHPWAVVDEAKEQAFRYHRARANAHLKNAREGNVEVITYSEIVYHASCLLLLRIANTTGCRERSPLLILFSISRARKKGSKQINRERLASLKEAVGSDSDWRTFTECLEPLVRINFDEGGLLSEDDKRLICRFGTMMLEMK